MPTTKKATIYLILIYLKPYIIYYLFKEVLISAPNMIYIKESEILSDEGICKKKTEIIERFSETFSSLGNMLLVRNLKIR